MKNILLLLSISVLLVTCSDPDEDTLDEMEQQQEQQQADNPTNVGYDTPWLLIEGTRLQANNLGNDSSIFEQFEVQGKTYHIMGLSRLCEFDGEIYVNCANNATNFDFKKYNNTIYMTSNRQVPGQTLDTKIFDPNTFTFTEFSQPQPSEFSDGQIYSLELVLINNELHLIGFNGLEDEVVSFKLNNATHIWELQMPKTSITRFGLGYRHHDGMNGESLISGRTINADNVVYRYNGNNLEIIHNVTNYTPVNGSRYFDILIHNNKYLMADGDSGSLRYIEGLNESSEAFVPEPQLQHFTIEGNYAILAAGPPTGGPELTVNRFRFINLANGNVTRFTGDIDKNNGPINSIRMESRWFDYTINQNEIFMVGNVDLTNPNFTTFKGGARFSITEPLF